MAVTPNKTSCTATQVADFLAQNPDFFQQHPQLAQAMHLPREYDGVISLANYQVAVLKDENKALKCQLDDLLQAAQANEERVLKIHDFNLGLWKCNNQKELLAYLLDGLSTGFALDFVHLKLFSEPADNTVNMHVSYMQGDLESLPQLADLALDDEPRVGRFPLEIRKLFFADQAPKVLSAALLSLGDHGVLALGSKSEDRFHPGMGNLFLQLVGDSTRIALGKILEKA